jgi:asparagine N-glycosylation enzyme membrane subunit Stt3
VCANLPLNLVHNPADIRQTSFALGVFYGALAFAELFLCLNFLHNKRAAILAQVILDVFSAVLKTIANQIAHELFSFLN